MVHRNSKMAYCASEQGTAADIRNTFLSPIEPITATVPVSVTGYQNKHMGAVAQMHYI